MEYVEDEFSLNPYYTGSYSISYFLYLDWKELITVLILIILEVTL